jgi:integrase
VEGIKRDRYGYRAYVKVGAVQREKRFPFGTPIKEMQDWRDVTRGELIRDRGATAPKGSIEAAAARYLKLVSAMPTIEQRTDHLELWINALGTNTPLHAVSASRIREVLQDWRHRYSAATCNKRRTALMHLFTMLGGKGGRNPVRDVPKFPVPDPLPRGRDPHLIDGKLTPRQPSRMRAACRVMLWTGMRPEELSRCEEDDWDQGGKVLIIRTAKGGRTRVIPLTPQATEALGEWFVLKGKKGVPQAAPMNRWIKHVTGLPIRVYDLRHSYGTALARRKARLDVIAALLGHSTLDLTRRYLLASVAPDALSATTQLAVEDTPPAASETASERQRNPSVSVAVSQGVSAKTP